MLQLVSMECRGASGAPVSWQHSPHCRPVPKLHVRILHLLVACWVFVFSSSSCPAGPISTPFSRVPRPSACLCDRCSMQFSTHYIGYFLASRLCYEPCNLCTRHLQIVDSPAPQTITAIATPTLGSRQSLLSGHACRQGACRRVPAGQAGQGMAAAARARRWGRPDMHRHGGGGAGRRAGGAACHLPARRDATVSLT